MLKKDWTPEEMERTEFAWQDRPRWANDWSKIIVPEGWVYVRDEDHDYGTCAVYRYRNGSTVHVELPD